MKNSQLQALSKFTRLDEFDNPEAKHTRKYYQQHANRFERHVANNQTKQLIRKLYIA